MDPHVQQLLEACELGDTKTIATLLNEGVDVDAADHDSVTALQTACANGQDKVVKLLLMRGAAVDKCNIYGWTPLMHAARYGHLSVMSLLVQHNANIHAKNRLGASPLSLACRGGCFQAVYLLIDIGAHLMNNSSDVVEEVTPLVVASLQGYDAILRLLLNHGSDVTFQMNSSGLSALMLAALNGHVTTAQILVERGCRPNLINANSRTALEIAIERGKREVKTYLDRKTQIKSKIKPYQEQPDIIDAVKSGNLNQVKEILEKDPKQRDASSSQDGATPLMFAAMTGRLDIVQLLVDVGCDMNRCDKISGWTAVMQATYHGKKNVVTYLVNMGADVTIAAKNGCTAFDMASLMDNVDTEMLRLLAAKTLSSRLEDGRMNSSLMRKEVMASDSVESDICDNLEKNGIKGWWSRMSDRFRNLKTGQTSGYPKPSTVESLVTDEETTKSHEGYDKSLEDKENVPSDCSHNPGYETVLLETKKTASFYLLAKNVDMFKSSSNIIGSETLKPILPPFLPTPSFGLDSKSKLSKANYSHKKSSKSSSAVMPTSSHPYYHMAKWRKTPGFMSSTTFSRHRTTPNISPSSSGGASSVSTSQKAPAVSPTQISSGRVSEPSLDVFSPKQKYFIPRLMENGVSPNSSASESVSLAPRMSQDKSSKDSTASTLTPSPSPIPDAPKKRESFSTSNGIPDDLNDLLQQLSLERYRPLFEEQEVDVESFLTLSDSDLQELGICHRDSRRQILSSISDLGSRKGK